MNPSQVNTRHPASGLRLALLRAAGRARGRGAPPRPLPTHASILVIRPDHLGDLLLSYPAVGLLRRALPEARLTYLVGPWSEEAARRGPPVDEVVTCPFPGFTRGAKPSVWQPYQLLLAQAVRLRGRFDAALVLRPDHWWGALLAAVAGIPVRVGYAVPECAPLLTHSVPWTGWQPADFMAIAVTRRLLALVSGARCDEPVQAEPFRVTSEEQSHADELLRLLGLAGGGPLVALHPGAGARLKLWPAERWGEVGTALVQRAGARIVVTGGPGERRLAEAVSSAIGSGAGCAADRTSLGQLAGVLSRAQLALGPDCAALHLAAAVGTPTLRLFGPTDPGVFMPAGKAGQHSLTTDLECRPCGQLERPPCGALENPACLSGVQVGRVVDAALEVLGAGDSGTRRGGDAATGPRRSASAPTSGRMVDAGSLPEGQAPEPRRRG